MTTRLNWALVFALFGCAAGWGHNPPPTEHPVREYLRGGGLFAAFIVGTGLWLCTVATVVGWLSRDPNLRRELRGVLPVLVLKLAAGFVTLVVLLAAMMTAAALTGGWGPGFVPGLVGAAVGFVLGWPLGALVAWLRPVERLGLAKAPEAAPVP